MNNAGTPFEEIKQTLLHNLYLLPSSYEIGLRVFDDQTKGSTRVVEYTNNIDSIRAALQGIQPKSGTFIGPSLLDAVRDLLAAPYSSNRLILITDGEGNDEDIREAQEARQQLQALKGAFKCYLILFSARQNVRTETPIGKIADILGCNLTASQEGDRAFSLATALQRIVRLDLSLLWLIISFIAYTALLASTARLIFAIKVMQRILVRRARSIALGFFLLLLMAVTMAHFVDILGRFSLYIWALLGGGTILLIILWTLDSLGLGTRRRPLQVRGYDDDPFR
jgi:hypothetical protein